MKGGWKETRGVQRPISVEIPVSESRIAPLNPFETKRKKAPSGTSSRVCDVQVAGRQGFEPWERSHVQRFSRPPHSTTLPPPRSAGGLGRARPARKGKSRFAALCLTRVHAETCQSPHDTYGFIRQGRPQGFHGRTRRLSSAKIKTTTGNPDRGGMPE